MFVRVDQHGSVTIPEDLREGLDGDSLLEVVRREDGVIELRPQGPDLATQDWFWSEQWQRMEREADVAFASGRFKTFDNVESFLAYLDDDRSE